jgi:phage protein D
MSYRPAYKITIGSHVVSSQDNHRLLELDVCAGLETPVHECRIVLPQFNDMNFQRDDSISVSLGYGNSLSKVFTGTTYRVAQGAERIVLTARSAFQRLVQYRSDFYFEDSMAGDIAAALCKETGVLPGNIGKGMRFAYNALGRDRSAYDHLRYLARQSGFDLYADENDRLVFAKADVPAIHPFSYGANLLGFRFSDTSISSTKAEVYGESPASLGRGTQGAHWLTKKEVKGGITLGSEATVRITDPTIRTLDNASLMSRALEDRLKNRTKGSIQAPGAPEIKIGDTLQINQLPESQHNGLYKTTGFRHRLSAASGFTSHFNIEKL